jgi:hypothetical protein
MGGKFIPGIYHINYTVMKYISTDIYIRFYVLLMEFFTLMETAPFTDEELQNLVSGLMSREGCLS